MGWKIMILLGILILSNMMAFVYVLAWDVSMIVMRPGYYNETTTRLGVDAGMLLLRSQEIVSDAIVRLKENSDLAYTDRLFLNNHIMGGTAFICFLLFVLIAFLKYVWRGEVISFRALLKIILLAIVIIGALQVGVAFLLTGQFVWPYQGMVDLALNVGVVWDSFWTTIPSDILANATVVA